MQRAATRTQIAHSLARTRVAPFSAAATGANAAPLTPQQRIQSDLQYSIQQVKSVTNDQSNHASMTPACIAPSSGAPLTRLCVPFFQKA